MISMHELQSQYRWRGDIAKDEAEVGEEGGGEGDGVDTEFPAEGLHDGLVLGGGGEERLAEELVAEAGAEEFYGGVVGVDFWGGG